MENPEPGKVLFEPFIGLGPRRFFDLFSMELGTGRKLVRKSGGNVVAWQRSQAQPRVPMLSRSFPGREEVAVAEIGLTTR